jgi:hypothetical protein
VLHLVSTAVDLPDVFDNARRWRQNPARRHTRRQSAALCPRFAGLYADAPATATLGNTRRGMDDKLRRVLELVAHHAPPAMASLQAAIPRSLGELRPGAPLIVVDVEVHDWPHMQFQPTWLTGQFGHRTGTRDYELSYMRIVQIAWCVRREDGECEHRNFYVSGTDRLISQKANEYHHITNAHITCEGIPIDHALQHFVDDCRWLRSVDGLLVAHQLEYDAGIIYKELGRLPSLRSYDRLVKALALRGICTMNTAAKRRGWAIHQTSDYCAISLPTAFKLFVEPLGISKWDDTFHHDSKYDVAKTLEVYDALYRSVPTRADLEAEARAAQGDLAESLQPAS